MPTEGEARHCPEGAPKGSEQLLSYELQTVLIYKELIYMLYISERDTSFGVPIYTSTRQQVGAS